MDMMEMSPCAVTMSFSGLSARFAVFLWDSPPGLLADPKISTRWVKNWKSMKKPIAQQRSTSDCCAPQSFPLEKRAARTLRLCPGAMNIHVQNMCKQSGSDWQNCSKLLCVVYMATLIAVAPSIASGNSRSMDRYGSFGCWIVASF